MRTEISEAVNFLSGMIRNKNVDAQALYRFREALEERFVQRFTSHWFPEKPIRGNAYRCVRIVRNQMDKIISAAGLDAGLSETVLLASFPPELSVWIDPYEVAYRIGEEGSVGVLYSFSDKSSSEDEMDTSSSGSSSSSRMSSPSPTLSQSSQSSLPPTPVSRKVHSSSRVAFLASERTSPDTMNEAYIIHNMTYYG